MKDLFKKMMVSTVLICMAILCSVSVYGQQKMNDKELAHYRQLYQIGEYDRIISELQEKNHAVNYDLLVLSGNVFHKKLDHENAVQAYSQALAMEDDPKLLVMRAAAYLDLGTLDLCLDDLNSAKKRIPEDPYLYFTLGNYSLDMGDLKNALKNYKKSIELDPDDDKVYFMMAVAYNEMGNYNRSIEIFETLTNKFPQAKFNIAISYLQNDQPEVANELLDDLETVYKDNSEFYFYRAETKYYQNDKANACIDYKKSADMGDTESEEIFQRYCQQNKRKGKSKRITTGVVKF